MIVLPTYAYQQHINWNSFNKCIEIDVQIHCLVDSVASVLFHSDE
jgi:hypothetical protein